MINISLTLSDIPKEKIVSGSVEKGSKKYLNISVDKMQNADNYGNTHTVYISQTKEERAAKTPKVYIGKGKEFIFEKIETVVAEEVSKKPKTAQTPIAEDDLPF